MGYNMNDLRELILPILYIDEHLVIINKPPGILIHPTNIDSKESVSVMKALRNQLDRWVWPVHRLDKPTSGILMFALDKESAKSLSDLFFNRRVKKKYKSVVRGITSIEETINYPLKDIPDKKSGKKSGGQDTLREAVTSYNLLFSAELPFKVGPYETSRYSYLEIIPQTGRQRQIRRHLKHIFHPIIGDTTHGDGKHNRFFRDHFNCYRLLLHASEMQFNHPVTQKNLHIKAPLDQQFSDVIKQLQLQSL
jgi:tRNA pseudouridine65 synthase